MNDPTQRRQRHRDDSEEILERYRGLATDVIAKLLADTPVEEWDLDLLAENMVLMVQRWEDDLPPCRWCGRPAWHQVMSSGAKQWCGLCQEGA